jgi:Zn-dependent protease with chaperone function
MDYDLLRIDLERSISDELYALFRGDIIQRVLRESKVEQSQEHLRMMLEGHAFRITERMAPRLYRLCHEVMVKLKFEEPVEFFVRSDPELNCAAYTRVEEDQSHIVMINSGLLERFDDDRMRFVIGHELGHLISRNSELTRIMGFVFPEGVEVPLIFQNRLALWNKLAELSADRYGFIASPDLPTCIRVFFELASGLNTERMAFDPMAYLEEMESVIAFFQEKGTLPGSHPINPVRIKALEYFSKSALYQAVAEGGELEDDAALQAQVDELQQILLRAGLSPLDEQRRRFLAAGGLIVAGADQELTVDELDRILAPLAAVTSFPRKYLESVMESGEVPTMFQESVVAILQANPSERYKMFAYLIDVALADRAIRDPEVELLYELGENVFGMPHKEVAQQLGAAIQRSFIPRFSGH